MRKVLTITLLFSGWSSLAWGQLSFRNAFVSLLAVGFQSLWSKAVVDVNGEGRYDIVGFLTDTIKSSIFWMQGAKLTDIDNEDWLDILGCKADAEDELWLNQPNGNHFVDITLQGLQSNSNGVGAKIVVSRTDGVQLVREVRSGENYGITNAYTQLIGLGPTAGIDQIEVQWPSGRRSVVRQPATDQFLTLTEPGSSCNCLSIDVTRIK